MAYKPRFFKPVEWRCKCCQDQSKHPFSEALLVYLDLLRAAHGAPITITSGYRCVAKNAAVGGSPRSYHLTGRAVDITAPKLVSLWSLSCRLQELRDPDQRVTEHIYVPARGYIHIAW